MERIVDAISDDEGLASLASVNLMPGSVRNWATTRDDEYIKQVKREMYTHLKEQRILLLKGVDPYGVGGCLNRADLADWNRRNPNFAIPTSLFAPILQKARNISEEK
jgi:hypothetical protein